MGDITSFEVLKSNGDYLAIRNDSTKMGNDDILYQFNMFETSADFGKRVGKVYTKLWEIATKDYVNHFFQFSHLPIGKINVPANAVSHQQFEFDVPDGYRVVTGISKGCSGSSWCFVTYFTFGINSKGKNFVDYYVLNADSNSHEVSPKIVAILQRII